MKAGYEVFKATVEGPGMPCRGLMVGEDDMWAAPAQLRQLVPAATAGLSAWR